MSSDPYFLFVEGSYPYLNYFYSPFQGSGGSGGDPVQSPLPSSANQYAGFGTAINALKDKPECASLVAMDSGMTVDQLVGKLNSAAVTTGTSAPGNGPVAFVSNPDGTYTYSYQWGYTANGNIELNGNYFPDPTQLNISTPDGSTTSFLQLVNQALGSSLNAEQFGTLVFLHELSHIADSNDANRANIDTNDFNQKIISKCIN